MLRVLEVWAVFLLGSAPCQVTDLVSTQTLSDRLRDPRDHLVQNSTAGAVTVFSRCLTCICQQLDGCERVPYIELSGFYNLVLNAYQPHGSKMVFNGTFNGQLDYNFVSYF